jgi:LPS-assembly protein
MTGVTGVLRSRAGGVRICGTDVRHRCSRLCNTGIPLATPFRFRCAVATALYRMLACGLAPNDTASAKHLSPLRNIFGSFCHELYSLAAAISATATGTVIITTFLTVNVLAQTYRPAYLGPSPAASSPETHQLKTIRPNAPPKDVVLVRAIDQEKLGTVYHLRGNAEVEATDMILKADQIDYDEDSGDAEARGNVRFEHFVRGEKLQASRAEYNLDDETGKFYDVSGTSPAKIDARAGMLTTTNPFYFQGVWAERLEDKYVLHDGMVTDCKMPGGWWTLRGPRFDLYPGDHAIGYKSIYRLQNVPIFYAPALYKSLKKMPRKSGFLTPNAGNSSRRGKMIGWGYYQTLGRSYDLTYRQQYFTQRGFAHHVELRGKPREGTDFDAVLYGVNDRGIIIGNTLQKQGGYTVIVTARSILGDGWEAKGEINYLSSFLFRQNFTESFHEAVMSQTRSTAYVNKHWSSFGVFGVFDSDTNFQSTEPNDEITIRKLPEGLFVMRERPVVSDVLPIYVSVEATGALLHRTEPGFETANFVQRADIAPRVMTAFSWKGIHIVPSFTFRSTGWGSSLPSPGAQPIGQNVYRNARDVTVDVILPSLERVFKAPKWLGAEKLKHVIEPRVIYRDVSGVHDFNSIILFDSTELVSNTNELEISITNRFYTKSKDGNVTEFVTWSLTQKRYFDPTFGGAVIPGQRNVVQSVAELTGYTFLDGPRNYSPVVSALRVNSKIGLEWRTDYDPLKGDIVNSGITADWRKASYFVSLGHNQVREDPVLGPSSNQIRGMVGIGNENRRGWNAGFSIYYDYKQSILQYATTQVTYNTDCCGFSVQFRRFAFGTRNENQFRVSFAIANIGSVGTLKRQERLF